MKLLELGEDHVLAEAVDDQSAVAALSDPVRRDILALLRAGERPASDRWSQRNPRLSRVACVVAAAPSGAALGV